MQNHLVSHIKNPHLVNDSTLHVVGVVSNPARYHSRYRLAREWWERMESTPGVVPYLVEAAYGDRHHEVTIGGHPRHLQVRIDSEIWIKENLMNLGVRHLLPTNFRYLMWSDCDIEFREPHWANETIHQLQHFGLVQPWQSAADLGATGNILTAYQSFGFLHQKGGPKQAVATDPYPYGHSGFAWACTRAFWEASGGLLDFAILGSADHHMAWAAVGQVEQSLHGKVSQGYARRCREWQTRAMRITHGEVGFVRGRIEHHFHGPKNRRYYQERWQILVNNNYDPDKDLMYDAQGIIRLCGKPALEHAILKYNRSRAEDSIEES